MSSAYFMIKFLKMKRKKKLDRQNYDSHRRNNYVTKKADTCRICMKDASIPIFNEDSSFNISEAISTFGGVELSVQDEYPKHICNTCHNLLESAVLFRKSAQDTDRILKQNSTLLYNNSSTVDDTDISNDYNLSSEQTHYCKLCKLHFQSWEDLIAHKTSRSHRNVRIQCPVCHGLLTAQLYKKHLASHKSATHLICDICGKLYRKDNLVRHLQLHNYKLPFQCQVCPYRGRFMESLKIHMRTHTGDKPFSCDKCKLLFITKSNLNRHLLTHKKERPFKCSECGRGFHIKRDMDTHFIADHVGLKDFNCKVCGNKYGTRKALMRHELRVHKRDKMAKGRLPLYMQTEYQNKNT